ncbi:MAG: hypothetical protein ABSB79_08395 [Syntrophales bacterium]|jgi:hypothetical protein
MKINQRTPKDPLIFEGSFPPLFKKIKITISPPHDVSSWFELLRMRPEDLGRIVHRDLVGPAIDHLLKKPGRGIHRGKEAFTNKIKLCSAYTFCLIDYWLKKPQEEWPMDMSKKKEWPKLFKDISEAKTKMKAHFHHEGKELKPKTHKLTAYIIERDFGKEREKLNPKSNPWTDEPDSFKKTYILNNPYMNWFITKLKDLEKTDIALPINLPITTDNPSEIVLALTQLASAKSFIKR